MISLIIIILYNSIYIYSVRCVIVVYVTVCRYVDDRSDVRDHTCVCLYVRVFKNRFKITPSFFPNPDINVGDVYVSFIYLPSDFLV